MTPAARIAAAIELLDAILAGAPAERALTNWGRANRFAGSGDRAAVRDHVFDALRCRGSYALLGGGLSGGAASEGAVSGRALMLGWARAEGHDPSAFFTGAGHAPAPLSAAEAALCATPLPAEAELAGCDWPEWLQARLRADLGADYDAVSAAMRHRAPVFLRVNLARATPAQALAALEEEGIGAEPHPLADSALKVTAGARRLAQARAYREGLVELQDASSQAMLALAPVLAGQTVLDYCAGGGGKALALAAAQPGAKITAHDIDAARMADIAPRAARAGARITLARPGALRGRFDLVLVDAPCSGSGTWRRSPEAKWRLTPARLDELVALQAAILAQASGLVAPGGRLFYMTCSVLDVENSSQISAFLAGAPAAAGWRLENSQRLLPGAGGDGFFGAVLRRD